MGAKCNPVTLFQNRFIISTTIGEDQNTLIERSPAITAR